MAAMAFAVFAAARNLEERVVLSALEAREDGLTDSALALLLGCWELEVAEDPAL